VNRTELNASVIERNVLRYTPAGIPVSECVLRHLSSQIEADLPRQVELEITAVAMGELANDLNRLLLGKPHRFTGFLAKKSRNSRNIVYHITEFELEKED